MHELGLFVPPVEKTKNPVPNDSISKETYYLTRKYGCKKLLGCGQFRNSMTSSQARVPTIFVLCQHYSVSAPSSHCHRMGPGSTFSYTNIQKQNKQTSKQNPAWFSVSLRSRSLCRGPPRRLSLYHFTGLIQGGVLKARVPGPAASTSPGNWWERQLLDFLWTYWVRSSRLRTTDPSQPVGKGNGATTTGFRLIPIHSLGWD